MANEFAAEFAKNVKKNLSLYEAGKIARVELHNVLLENVDPETVGEFVALVPPDILREIERYVLLEAPRSEEEWKRARFFHIGGVTRRGEFDHQRNGLGIDHPSLQRFRKTVEALRLFFERGR